MNVNKLLNEAGYHNYIFRHCEHNGHINNIWLIPVNSWCNQ